MRTTTSQARNLAVAQPTAVIASAARRNAVEQRNGDVRGVQPWQEKAWHFYDTIGEFRAGVNWVGNVLSRARLYATYDDGSGPKPVSTPAVSEVMEAFGGGVDGRRVLLHDYGVLYSVSGEAWTVGMDTRDGKTIWTAYAPGEVVSDGEGYRIESERNPLPKGAVVIQSWRPHPRKHKFADSPARAALPILAEIEALTQHIEAQTNSRLASAGMLFVPNEIAATAVGATRDTTSSATAEAYVKMLAEVASRTLRDRSDPTSVVPIVSTGDADYIDKVKYVKFWSELDQHAIELRTEAIRRLALSLDMPPEVLTGTGDVNHWGAWAIDESAIKSHTEPLLFLICSDLTVGYLRPALEGVVPDPERYAIAADTSEMRLRPNRSKEALELYDRGVLDEGTLRTETGFEDSNGLDVTSELERWVLLQMIKGNTSAAPEQVSWALGRLGFEDVPTPDSEPRGARETPSLEEHPQSGPPEESALLAAAEQMVYRALERAGNRLRNRTRTAPPGVSAAETYLFVPMEAKDVDFALEDAWSHVDRFADQYGWSPVELRLALDGYCKMLLSMSKPYSRETLGDWLRVAHAHD